MNTTFVRTSKRLEKFDIGKGIAIFLVVIGHLLEQTFCIGEEIQKIIVFCHMPVFFFISGFFLHHSVNKHSKIMILKNKVKQLIIPFICWSCISLIANVILAYKNGPAIEIIKNQFFEIFICARSVWFLVVLCISQCAFLGLISLSERLRLNKYMVLFLGWIIISFIVPNPYLSMYKFKWLFPFLIVGAMYAENEKKFNTIVHNLKIISLVFPLVCLMTSDGNYYNMYLEFKYSDFQSVMAGFIYYLISILGIAFIFEISTILEKTKLGRILVDCGKHSLEIYVMHMFFIKFIVVIPFGIVKDNVFVLSVGIVLYAVAIIALIVLLSEHVFKRIKVYRFIMGKK